MLSQLRPPRLKEGSKLGSTSTPLRKKQASAFQLQPGIRGEVRLVERAFGIGPEMMSELMSLHGAELEQIAIQQGL